MALCGRKRRSRKPRTPTVDGRILEEILQTHQLRLVVYPIIYYGFYHVLSIPGGFLPRFLNHQLSSYPPLQTPHVGPHVTWRIMGPMTDVSDVNATMVIIKSPNVPPPEIRPY